MPTPTRIPDTFIETPALSCDGTFNPDATATFSQVANFPEWPRYLVDYAIDDDPGRQRGRIYPQGGADQAAVFELLNESRSDRRSHDDDLHDEVPSGRPGSSVASAFRSPTPSGPPTAMGRTTKATGATTPSGRCSPRSRPSRLPRPCSTSSTTVRSAWT
jgi:hypothetical protein